MSAPGWCCSPACSYVHTLVCCMFSFGHNYLFPPYKWSILTNSAVGLAVAMGLAVVMIEATSEQEL